MGFFKKVFGGVADELSKAMSDTTKEINEIRKEIHEDIWSSGDNDFSKSTLRDKLGKPSHLSKRETEGNLIENSVVSDVKERFTSVKDFESPKILLGICYAEILYNGQKYALKYRRLEENKTTEYIYDDVDYLGDDQIRLAKKQVDGSMRYGVACLATHLFITDCDYTKVTFLDGSRAVFAIDEDGDEYAIDPYGNISTLEVYREKIINEMN